MFVAGHIRKYRVGISEFVLKHTTKRYISVGNLICHSAWPGVLSEEGFPNSAE